MTKPGSSLWRSGWPLGLLVVLVGSRWLLEGAWPHSASTLASQSVGCFGAAGVCAAARFGGPRRSRSAVVRDARAWRRSWMLALAGGLALSGPALAQAVAGRYLNPNNATLALALCPAVVAVMVTSAGVAEGADLTSLLWPGLAGLAGLLLLLPEPSLGSWRSWVGLGLLPVLVGVGGACFGDAAGRPAGQLGARRSRTALSFLVAALVLGSLALYRKSTGDGLRLSVDAMGLDGLTALVSLWTLEMLGSVRWSAQYLLIPLLALIEGLIFLRPVLDGRSYLGLGLLALSAAYQLAAPALRATKLSLRETEAEVPEA